ncbi:hypothetical protein ACIOEW_33020 [Streptomyces sp. NPDC087901]|uniref:hypothetical protein n=1 Tax=Streptomyces sp. NPDC087901 TaxID=3365818 RepID=UPI0038305BAB
MPKGWIAAPPDAFASNGQVTSRISPRLIDLFSALATGTVGAFAPVRIHLQAGASALVLDCMGYGARRRRVCARRGSPCRS